jgi:regulator of RNase E activity RraA
MMPFNLKIVTPDGLFFDGQAEQLIVRTITGDIGIMARHMNYLSPLGMGRAVVISDGQRRTAACMGGMVSVVRGITTRTTNGGVADSTWRDLATIRIVDNVIPGLRSALRAKFRRAKNTEQSRGAIRAQVVLELENFLKREIITAYEGVTVSADETDPTRALVEFSFTVAHGLNQIWLSAHITV